MNKRLAGNQQMHFPPGGVNGSVQIRGVPQLNLQLIDLISSSLRKSV